MTPPIQVRSLGRVPYEATWRAMQSFTAGRNAHTEDEIWLVEHAPIFTLGQAGRREHLLTEVGIPVLAIDRGGQVTYHGPGQVVAYVLLDLRRRGYGVKELVRRLEQAVIEVLAAEGIVAMRRTGAPGVYVGTGEGEAKIAALGLRIRNGCSYHGLSLNVAMDLSPFAAINPCGYAGLAVTQMQDQGCSLSPARVAERLTECLLRLL